MKITVIAIKLSPIVLNLYLILVLLLAFTDIDTGGVDSIFGHSLWLDIVLYNISKRFKFCSWHRVLILNLILMSSLQFLIMTYPELMSSWTAFYIMITSWITTSITSTILYFKYGCCKIEESK